MFKAILTTLIIAITSSAATAGRNIAHPHYNTATFSVATYQTYEGEVYLPLNEGTAAYVALAVEGNTEAAEILYADSDQDSNALFGVSPTTGEFLGTYANALDYTVATNDGQWVEAGARFIDPVAIILAERLIKVNALISWVHEVPESRLFGQNGHDLVRNCAEMFEAITYDLNKRNTDGISELGTIWDSCLDIQELVTRDENTSSWDRFFGQDLYNGLQLAAHWDFMGVTFQGMIDDLFDGGPSDMPYTPAGVVAIFINAGANASGSANVITGSFN